MRSTVPHLTAECPWHTASIDVMGSFPVARGHRFIISLVDIYSCFTILFSAADHFATTVARGLLERVIAYFGVPASILSDQGMEFTSQVWAQLQQFLGCKMSYSSLYYPQGNSVVERSYCTINNALRATPLEAPRLT